MDNNNTFRGISTNNPILLFFRILGIIFIAEFIVMVGLAYFDVESGTTLFVLDSIVLSLISAPFLYFGVVRIVANKFKEEADRTHCALKNELIAKAHSEKLALKAYSDNIVKCIPSGLIVASRDLRVSSVNPAFCHMFSNTEENIVGRFIHEVLPFRGLKEMVNQVLLDGCRERDIVLNLTNSDKNMYYQVNINEISTAEKDAEKQILIIIDNITERKESEKQILHMAYHDNLTGLPNRRLLIDRLRQIIARMRRENHLAALLFIDLDSFKILNDTLGHEGGDEILKTVARNLTKCSRSTDTVARIGGDEFIVLLPDIEKTEAVVPIVQRFFETFNSPLNIGGHEFTLTASIGISIFPNDGEDEETLIKNSDIAMYRAKAEGKNTWQYYSSNQFSNTPQ